MTTPTPTVNPNIPATDSSLSSAVVRGNFAATYNDIQNIYTLIAAIPQGTIATQDFDNITVTGGTIDGTTIGQGAAAQGFFTNLSFTGTLTVPANYFPYSDIQKVSTMCVLGNPNPGSSDITEIPLDTTLGTLGFAFGQLGVINNTSTQKVIVDKNGTDIGTRHKVNFIEGTNITLTVADNVGSDRVDVTINAPNSGNVFGPNSSTNNAIATYNGITGKTIQNSGAFVDGSGNITGNNLSGTNTGNVTLTGENYLSIAGQAITVSAVTLSGTNVTGTLPPGKGGTGQTTYTDGQLLIGNTSSGLLNKATLTAGSGIGITNAGGSITITATGTAGVNSLNTLAGNLSLTSSDSTVTITPSGTSINLQVASNPLAIWALYR